MTSSTTHNDSATVKAFSFKDRYPKLYDKGLAVGNLMYGSTQRTWITLAVTFGMLVAGISMMQAAASGGLCAAGM